MLLPLIKIFGANINAALSAIGTVENIKASLAGSVLYGVCYHDFKTFNPKEIYQYVVIYIFRGFSPSPQL